MANNNGLRMIANGGVPARGKRKDRIEPGKEFTANDAQEARDLWQAGRAEYADKEHQPYLRPDDPASAGQPAEKTAKK